MAQPDEDFEGRFRRHFPRRSNDLTLIVLKGHLLMEEAINTVLSTLLPDSKALDAARPTLFLRLRLVRALINGGALGDVLDAAEKLNSLRNALAHNLEPPQIQQQIAALLQAIEDSEGDFGRESMALRLRRCISFLVGRLHGIGEGFAAVRALS